MRNRYLNYMLIPLLAVIAVSASSAQELMPANKEHALQYLEATKKEVLDAEQLRLKLVRYWNLTPAEAG